jgi:DNA mismatch repair protein MutL
MFLSLLDEIEGEKVENVRNRLLATMACKTAIKAGQILSSERMNYLVEELFNLSDFALCPHGRPVVVKLKRREIEKQMRRPQN